MKKCGAFISFIYFSILTVMVCLPANCAVLISYTNMANLIPLFIVMFLAANIMPSLLRRSFPSVRLRICCHGVSCLKLFLASCTISAIYHIIAAFLLLPTDWALFLISAGICILAEAILFWNGIISVYCTSVQLGIKHRVIGILCGMIPIAHFFALMSIIRIVSNEVDFECDKAKLNIQRKELQVCKTKYPVLLVHGVFFRDYKFPNYWGRIPKELKENGAEIYYGNHQSAASVANSGRELARRINQIVTETGCEKVNIIAHSKGGLDSRYALSCCGIEERIASLTTINTPHYGCEFADYLLNKVPLSMQRNIAYAYNSAMKRLGDSNPDFMSAVRDLTAERCRELNDEMKPVKNVYCQSIGSRLNKATNGKFPLNFTYHLVKYFDGPNDGLVSEESFKWGEKYRFATVSGKRGISHGDMVDLNRENIPGFDVREFYVNLLSELKTMGL